MKFNLKNVFLSVGMLVFSFALFGLVSVNKVEAVGPCTATATGLWNDPNTWDVGCNTNTIPAGPDTVTIPTGITVTITGAGAAATTLNLTGTAVLTISDSNTLAVSGATTIGATSTLTTGIGTFTTGTLSVTGLLNLGTGPSTVGTTTIVNSGGEIRLSGASGQKTFSGAVTISLGGIYSETVANTTGITFSNTLGNAGTFTTSTGGHTFSGAITNTGTFNNAVPGVSMTNLAASTSGTFNYTGGAQTVQLVNYYNLGLSSTDTNPQVKTIGVFTVLNTLAISGGAQAFLTGDSTANNLTLGGPLKASGYWGSTSSTAAHQSNYYFASTGKVLVATGSTASYQPITITTDLTNSTNTTTPDTTAPTGISVSINAGISTASSLSSTLTFTAVDATQMLVSNDAGFAGASWQTYTTSLPWTLTSGDGVKTVYAKFKDAVGNMSVAVSDTTTVSGSGTVALPNEPTQGCSAGNVYNTSTGALCVNTAVATIIAGCNNRNTGFSTASGQSCVGNAVSALVRSYNFGTTTLRNGSRGEAVMELQRFLNDKLNLGLVVDGKLGPKTIAVIKQWQASHGLVADGLIGPKTKAQMNAEAN